VLQRVGQVLAVLIRNWVPDPFVFALGLTLIVGLLALGFTDSTPSTVIRSWYDGFWALLGFGMQMVLILSTGYAIALAPVASKAIDRISRLVQRPAVVYFMVSLITGLLTLVSWGWVVMGAVLARELAHRVRGLDYAYLTACVYVASGLWVSGLSSSIPLLMNTEGNFLIESGVLESTLGVDRTLGSTLNLAYVAAFVLLVPTLMLLLRPRRVDATPIDDLRDDDASRERSVEEEAASLSMPGRPISERLNHGTLLPGAIAVAGLVYVASHFREKGFSIDLNIMIFTFLMLGMLAHRTPLRFVVAMRRACANVSGIIFQYPFYAGIMGIMTYSGLGAALSEWIVGHASVATLPMLAQFAGAIVNFAIPSAGGEWAVIGPSIAQAAQSMAIEAGLPPDALLSRVAMAVAYGETSTNLLQPFYLLIILPVMGAGVRIQARDVVGYLVLPFLFMYTLTALLVSFVPL
jgi:short-chain fatty acids transporter